MFTKLKKEFIQLQEDKRRARHTRRETRAKGIFRSISVRGLANTKETVALREVRKLLQLAERDLPHLRSPDAVEKETGDLNHLEKHTKEDLDASQASVSALDNSITPILLDNPQADNNRNTLQNNQREVQAGHQERQNQNSGQRGQTGALEIQRPQDSQRSRSSYTSSSSWETGSSWFYSMKAPTLQTILDFNSKTSMLLKTNSVMRHNHSIRELPGAGGGLGSLHRMESSIENAIGQQKAKKGEEGLSGSLQRSFGVLNGPRSGRAPSRFDVLRSGTEEDGLRRKIIIEDLEGSYDLGDEVVFNSPASGLEGPDAHNSSQNNHNQSIFVQEGKVIPKI